jgi:phosphoglucosamine mutase
MMLLKYNLRGVVGEDFGEKEIRFFATYVISYIYTNKYNPSIIIAKDNRVSSDYILNLLDSILLQNGIEVNIVGISTTPELIYLTKKFKFSLGIMITASHNSCEYNGFKCFNSNGEMLDIQKQGIKHYRKKTYGRVVDVGKYKELYLRYLKNELNSNNIKCVFDCANGACVDVVRKIFPRQQIINVDKTGRLINHNCGSEHLENIIAICKKNKKIGFAFDGDGDRVIAIDEKGEVIDGDKILYILASQKLGFGDKVIGTQISSLGLEISLRRLGVCLARENVGAKYVARRMKKECALLGGESCGHIFLAKCESDGIAIVIELLNILNRTGLSFSQLLSGYKQMYKLMKSIDIDKVKNCKELELTDKECRLVVRRSATENVVRVFVEGEAKGVVEARMNDVVQRLMQE